MNCMAFKQVNGFHAAKGMIPELFGTTASY
jgi:hypothetical protein